MDENLAQENYFAAYSEVINALDPKAADFQFQFNNLRDAVLVSHLLTDDEKKRLKGMLHILQVRSADPLNPSR